MGKLYFIILLILVVNPLYANIYQWVDSQGVTHFSDSSHEDAKKIELPPRLYSSSNLKIEHQKHTHQSPKSKSYEIAIVQPENEAFEINSRKNISLLE